jgi:mannosylglycerate hydrolase
MNFALLSGRPSLNFLNPYFSETSPGTFVVSAVKQSEDGRGWLVRGYNITGEAILIMLKPWKPFKKVGLVNLAEKRQSMLESGESGRVTLPVGGHKIVTVLFQA